MNSKVNQFTVESLLFVEKQCSWVTLAHNLHPINLYTRICLILILSKLSCLYNLRNYKRNYVPTNQTNFSYPETLTPHK